MKKQQPAVSLPFAPHEIPSIRIETAMMNKSNQNLCFVVGGGLGDRICAEPTLRFALSMFKDVSISIICETPELFRHLSFKEVFDLKKTYPVVGRHLYLNTYPKSPLLNQFINANMVNLVDYASISALRCQLPPEFKEIQLFPDKPTSVPHINEIMEKKYVVIHPGISWPSRTFPAWFWNQVIDEVWKRKFIPIVIGTQIVEGLNPDRFINLSGKTSLNDYLWICKNATALITNDSSPIHAAAAGKAKIAYIATCRRGDLLLHQRQGIIGWGMKDFATRQMSNGYSMIPNHLDEQHISTPPPGITVEDCLPPAAVIMDWIQYA